MIPLPPISMLFPYTTLFRSRLARVQNAATVGNRLHLSVHRRGGDRRGARQRRRRPFPTRYVLRGGAFPLRALARRGFHHLRRDRKSTRLNSSHLGISYAVFC